MKWQALIVTWWVGTVLYGTAHASSVAPLAVQSTPLAQAALAKADYQPDFTIVENKQVYDVQRDGRYTKESVFSFRLDTQNSVQGGSQVPLAYSTSMQQLDIVEAYTTTKAGKRIDVPPENIKLQQSPQSVGAPMFSDHMVKFVVFPSTEVGAVLTLRTRLTQKQPIFAGQFVMTDVSPRVWAHQGRSISVRAPAAMPMQVQAVGFEGGEVTTSRPGTREWRWTLLGAAAHKPEAGSVSPMEYSPRVFATSLSSWDQAGQLYMAGARDKAAVTPRVQQLADEVTQGITDRRQQAEALYNWVTSNIRYVFIALGAAGSYVPHDADGILTARYGDCKDHATLLQALLAAKGIASSPVLINIGSAWYTPPPVPMIQGAFDHCILYIHEFNLYVDATNQWARFGQLSRYELSKPVLIADDGQGHGKLSTTPPRNADGDAVKSVAVMRISMAGDVEGERTVDSLGFRETEARATASGITPGTEADVAARGLRSSDQDGTGSYRLGNAHDLRKAYRYSTRFALPGLLDVSEPDAVPVLTGVPAFTKLQDLARDSSLVEAERDFPLSWANDRREEQTEIVFPTNVKLISVPKSIRIENATGRYEATYSMQGQTVLVSRTLVMNVPHPIVQGETYTQLRALSAAVARDLKRKLLYQPAIGTDTKR